MTWGSFSLYSSLVRIVSEFPLNNSARLLLHLLLLQLGKNWNFSLTYLFFFFFFFFFLSSPFTMEGKDPHDCIAHPVCWMLISTRSRLDSSNCSTSMVSSFLFLLFLQKNTLVLVSFSTICVFTYGLKKCNVLHMFNESLQINVCDKLAKIKKRYMDFVC